MSVAEMTVRRISEVVASKVFDSFASAEDESVPQ